MEDWLKIVLFSIVTSTVVSKTLLLHTRLGTIIGTADYVELNDVTKSVTRYLGIPFAKPPVGDRRFRRPEPFGNFSSISAYNATYFRPHCPQEQVNYTKHVSINEDCLYLNVFVPGEAKKPYPVMIWIYGGAFKIGGADIYSGDILSAFHDVIVVTFNYRLNVFGFISDGSPSSGNYGLWDQKLAIHWVHDNIDYFGGNSELITLFGNSAGAASVVYQALHTGNRGMFKRIISQSGSPLAEWAVDKEPFKTFKEFATSMNCFSTIKEDIYNCLRKHTTDHLVRNSFVPVIDGDFIKENPDALFANKTEYAKTALSHFLELDFLLGVNDKDGAKILQTYLQQKFSSVAGSLDNGISLDNFQKLIESVLEASLVANATSILKPFVEHQYTDWARFRDPAGVREKLVDLVTDVNFLVPAVKMAYAHARSKTGKLFFYEFAHKPVFMSEPKWLTGAAHTLEIPYVFGFPNSFNVIIGQPVNIAIPKLISELKLATVMSRMWTNFAKTGDPNSDSMSDIDVLWPQYDLQSQKYMKFTSNLTSPIMQHLEASRVAFWTNLVPDLMNYKECNTTVSLAHRMKVIVLITVILALLALIFNVVSL